MFPLKSVFLLFLVFFFEKMKVETVIETGFCIFFFFIFYFPVAYSSFFPEKMKVETVIETKDFTFCRINCKELRNLWLKHDSLSSKHWTKMW